MERPYISQELRRLVADRADRLCEYCLMHEQAARLLERQFLINRNKYSHPSALRRIGENPSKEDG